MAFLASWHAFCFKLHLQTRHRIIDSSWKGPIRINDTSKAMSRWLWHVLPHSITRTFSFSRTELAPNVQDPAHFSSSPMTCFIFGTAGGPASAGSTRPVFSQPLSQDKDPLQGGEGCGTDHPQAAWDRKQGKLSTHTMTVLRVAPASPAKGI